MRALAAISLLVLAVVVHAATPQPAPTFSDNFSRRKLDATKWNIATYKSPDSKPGVNLGTYVPEAIDLSQGMLRIAVVQGPGPDGVVSKGGAIISKERFGFGRYEFVMRMTSTSTTPNGVGAVRSGAVSSGFVYFNNSESEIDIEFVGDKNTVWMSNWLNPVPSNPPSLDMRSSDEVRQSNLSDGFHTYALTWSPKSIQWYIDGTLVAMHQEHVCSTPAYIIIQHRGTNSEKWGGKATPGVTRYMYVKSVSFTAAPK